MSIPARQIVAVTPRLLTAGGTELVLNGLVLTKNSLMPLTNRVISFTDADSVGDYFGYSSAEYRYSVVYFKSYDNSVKKPQSILFGAYVDEAKAAWLRGGVYTGTLETIKAITSGSLSITINGTAQNITGLDFSSASSLSAVATVIQAQLTGTTVVYSSETQSFTITTTTTGTTATIAFPTTPASGTDIATTLNLTASSGAVISQGCAVQTVSENMESIIASSNNWVSFSTTWAASNQEILEFADWSGKQGVEYIYLPYSNEAALTAVGSSTSIADLLKTANATATSGQYGDYTLAAFVSGSIAAIDWNRTNGTISLAFKQQDGIAANVETASDANQLLSKTWNFYGNYATRNDNFIWYYNGSMFGDYGFIDTYINAVWLNNALQLAMMNGLETYPRIPYSPRGYGLIRSTLMGVIERAKNNGVIDIGVSMSAVQQAELISEYGTDDIITQLSNNGYCIKIEDAGVNIRVTRESPNIDIWYTYGGSVQKINITSTTVA